LGIIQVRRVTAEKLQQDRDWFQETASGSEQVSITANNVSSRKFSRTLFQVPMGSSSTEPPIRRFLNGRRREVRFYVMTPAPRALGLRASNEGKKTRSPRIGTTPGLTLGPSLFSQRSWKTGKVKCLKRNLSVTPIKKFV
jgi:hypothetical protein